MSYNAPDQSGSECVPLDQAAPVGRGEHTRASPFRDGPHTQARRARQAARAGNKSKVKHLVPALFVVLAGIVYFGLTEGGSRARQITPMASYLEHMLEKIGLGLTQVTVTGQRMTDDHAIYDQLQLAGHKSVWLLNTEAARARIESLPWVLSASLKRVFPDRLRIEIRERTPRAVWSDGRRSALIDASGRILGPPVKGHFGGLPTIFGDNARAHSDAILKLTASLPALVGKVSVYEWTANRRWTLHLKTGQKILLPASGLSLALLQLTRGRQGRRLLDSDFHRLDLRIANQAAIDMRK